MVTEPLSGPAFSVNAFWSMLTKSWACSGTQTGRPDAAVLEVGLEGTDVKGEDIGEAALTVGEPRAA